MDSKLAVPKATRSDSSIADRLTAIRRKYERTAHRSFALLLYYYEIALSLTGVLNQGKTESRQAERGKRPAADRTRSSAGFGGGPD